MSDCDHGGGYWWQRGANGIVRCTHCGQLPWWERQLHPDEQPETFAEVHAAVRSAMRDLGRAMAQEAHDVGERATALGRALLSRRPRRRPRRR